MISFESIALHISDTTDSELLHAFVWKLKDRTKSVVKLRDSKTLTEMAKIALDKRLKPIQHQFHHAQQMVANHITMKHTIHLHPATQGLYPWDWAI